MKQFSFTDGSYFLILEEADTKIGSGAGQHPGEIILVANCVDYVTPNFTKTDLDGHTWSWNGSTLSLPDMRSPNNQISVTINQGLIFALTEEPFDSSGSVVYGINNARWLSYTVYSGSSINDSYFYGGNGYSSDYRTSTRQTTEWFTNEMSGGATGGCINYNPTTNKIEVLFCNKANVLLLPSTGGAVVALSTIMTNFPNSVSNFIPDNDPYSDGGQADSYGGNGVFDNSTTNIDFPPLPSISASDAGFITLFNPTLAQMRSLQSYLWGDLFDIDTFKKVLSNPMDVIMGLSIVPFDVPSGGAREIMIGNIASGVTANVATSQFLSFDMGTLTIQSGVGDSYLDYSPYTKASIFLPYIGWQDLDIDEIMNKTLSLKYYCDILSGGCVAMLKCGGSVLYTFAGQCSLNIPLTSIDYTSTISSALSAVQHVAGAIGGGIAGGMMGNALGVAGSAVNGVAGLASDVMNAKPQYQRSGSVGGASGLLSPQIPYIELTRPSIQRPKYQDTFVGYPSYVYKKVSQLVGTGFNAFSEIILENIGLTADEMRELEEIMKGGVVL